MDHVERMRRMFEGGPVDRMVRRPMYYFTQTWERWNREGLPAEVAKGGQALGGWPQTLEDIRKFEKYFGFDPDVWMAQPTDLGVCEAPLVPRYEEKVLRLEGEHEIVQDFIGRVVRYPKGVRDGVMPTYLKHTVASRDEWERDVRPRLDPATPERWGNYAANVASNRERLARGEVLHIGSFIGGYMYLRSLVGPLELPVLFYDDPDLVHAMMRTWRDLVLACLKRVQADVGPYFRLYLAEDICYKSGPLISPDMIRRFLLPYYRDFFEELQAGQRDPIHFEVDTDGNCLPVVDLYREVGMTAMSPWEVASGCDVVEAGRRWPDLHIRGGIDKRVLAEGPEAIDRTLRYIMPPMVKRGRYIPNCDHAVPQDVSLANYMYFRKRIQEMDH